MLLFRSVSDPGPPLLLSRELKVPSYSSKVEPLDNICESSNQLVHQLRNQQKVIEEFEKDGIDFRSKLIHVETDGCNTMVGSKNGAQYKFQKEVPH